MGLDEKAVQAVKQYRFKPAMENEKPVPVELKVEVNFQFSKWRAGDSDSGLERVRNTPRRAE
jgi:hypothetical protein